MTLWASDFVFQNGLAFSPDERVLYITDFRRGVIRGFSWSIRRVISRLPSGL
jgi:sugar lactone lactonase YvrE